MDGGYGGGKDGAVGVSEEENGLFGVVDVGDGEAGMVFGEVDDGVFAGDVGGGDYGVLVPGDGWVEGDGGDAAAGNGAADGGSEPHVGEGDVVDVLGAAEYFGCAFFTHRRLADDLGCPGHEGSVKNRTKTALARSLDVLAFPGAALKLTPVPDGTGKRELPRLMGVTPSPYVAAKIFYIHRLARWLDPQKRHNKGLIGQICLNKGELVRGFDGELLVFDLYIQYNELSITHTPKLTRLAW